MIRRRAVVGLSLLCALLFCALAAQGASAAAHTSENTTAFTCVKGGGKLDFADPHCDETVPVETGEYGHELLQTGPTTIEATNEKTKNNTTERTPPILKTLFAGVAIEITCQKAKSITEEGGKKSLIENGGTGTEHKVTGTIITDFEECKAEKPANCKVKQPIVTKAIFKGVDQLPPNKEGMGVEFTGDGSETFTEITFEGEKCALKGKTFPIKGNVIGTGTPGPTAKEGGATLIFDESEGMQNLAFGEKPATFLGTFTTRMHTLEQTGNPITLTTTT